MPSAYVYVVKSKKYETVDASELYEVDEARKKKTLLSPTTFEDRFLDTNFKFTWFNREDKKFKVVFIFYVAGNSTMSLIFNNNLTLATALCNFAVH